MAEATQVRILVTAAQCADMAEGALLFHDFQKLDAILGTGMVSVACLNFALKMMLLNRASIVDEK